MQEYEGSVLMLDDDDFTDGHAGDLAFVNGTTRVVSAHRIIIWNGRVLKNAYGPIFAEPNAQISGGTPSAESDCSAGGGNE